MAKWLVDKDGIPIKEALRREIKYLRELEFQSLKKVEEVQDTIWGSSHRLNLRVLQSSYSRILKDLDNN